MAIYLKKIDDQSSTAGTGAQTLLGPANQSSGPATYLGSIANNGDVVTLCLTDSVGGYEVSPCTVSISGAVVTITRGTPIASSAANLAAVNFVGVVRVTNYIPANLELVLFNLQYQIAAATALAAMAADISDLKDAMTLLLDGGNP